MVLGLDGVPFELLNRFADRMPFVSELREQGSEATLHSTTPPVTYPAWMSYATGRDPGELGVYDWQGIDIDARESVQHGPSTFHGVGFWEADVPALSVNLPGAPAVARKDAISVPGPGGSLSDLPHDVVTHLPDEYDVTPGRMEVDESIDQMRAKFDAFSRLVEKMDHPPITHLTVFAIDGVMHYNWDDDEALGRAFEAIDQGIASIVKSTDADYDVVLMSDHGMQRLHRRVDLNYWFRERGLLSLSDTKGSEDGPFLTRAQLSRLLSSVGLSAPQVKSLLPERVVDAVRDRVPADDRDFVGDSLDRIDFESSTAFAAGSQIFVLKAGRSERVREALLDLEADGQRVITEVSSPSELYRSVRRPNPDLVVGPFPGYLPRRSLSDQLFAGTEDPSIWNACHHPEGILVGPDDIAEEMTIHELMSAIASRVGFELPISEATPAEAGGGDIDDHLRSLGYME